MNSKTRTRIIALALLAALTIPIQLAAQDKQDSHNMHHHYQLIDLGTFGGPNSFLSYPLPGEVQINRRGLVVGIADTTAPDPYSPNCFFDCLVDHAFAWQDGMLTDLGSLAGTNNSSWAFASNDRGQIVGISENGAIDPLTGFPEVHGVVWKDGQIIDVGTLGGSESFTGNINNRGKVVGGALNATPDSFGGSLAIPLFFPVTTQQHAFSWKNGTITDLGTLGGPDSQAQYVNASGQIAGQSFTNSAPNSPVTAPGCSTSGIPTEHPFLWDGTMLDLGSLGGTCGYANWLTDRGQVIGTMTLAGDTTNHGFTWDKKNGLIDLGTLGGDNSEAWFANDAGEVVGRADFSTSSTYHHAFLWKKGHMTDLGTVAGQPRSTGFAINSKTQIVGDSSENGWLWENGSIVDLNTLVPPDTGFHVGMAGAINDRGEIVANGLLSNGEHVVLLIPCDENHSGVEGCDYSMVDAAAAAAQSAERPYVPRAPQRLPQSRRSKGYHIPGVQSPGR
jgi:probable HAF family extracellular repeat protein